jgi:hypothetical protein
MPLQFFGLNFGVRPGRQVGCDRDISPLNPVLLLCPCDDYAVLGDEKSAESFPAFPVNGDSKIQFAYPEAVHAVQTILNGKIKPGDIMPTPNEGETLCFNPQLQDGVIDAMLRLFGGPVSATIDPKVDRGAIRDRLGRSSFATKTLASHQQWIAKRARLGTKRLFAASKRCRRTRMVSACLPKTMHANLLHLACLA